MRRHIRPSTGSRRSWFIAPSLAWTSRCCCKCCTRHVSVTGCWPCHTSTEHGRIITQTTVRSSCPNISVISCFSYYLIEAVIHNNNVFWIISHFTKIKQPGSILTLRSSMTKLSEHLWYRSVMLIACILFLYYYIAVLWKMYLCLHFQFWRYCHQNSQLVKVFDTCYNIAQFLLFLNKQRSLLHSELEYSIYWALSAHV